VKSKPPVRVIQRNGQRAWCRYLSANRTTGPSSRDKQVPCPDPADKSEGCPSQSAIEPTWPKVFSTVVITRTYRERREGEDARFSDEIGAQRSIGRLLPPCVCPHDEAQHPPRAIPELRAEPVPMRACELHDRLLQVQAEVVAPLIAIDRSPGMAWPEARISSTAKSISARTRRNAAARERP
jgi:hypothetical protein